MWKVIQGDEKAEFLKDYQDGKYCIGEAVGVDLTSNSPSAYGIDKLSVHDFTMDGVIILVKVD